MTGVTVMELSVALETGRVVVPETSPNVAVIVGVPGVIAVAMPLGSTVVIELSDEFQVTCFVRSWVVLSENVPVAVNCCVVPAATLGLVGVTAIEVSRADVTVRVVELETEP